MRSFGRVTAEALIGIAILLATASCTKGPQDYTLMKRVAAPDGKTQAVWLEGLSDGAITNIEEEIYLVTKPGPLRFADRVFAKGCIKDVDLRWTGPRTLLITYSAGKDAGPSDGLPGTPHWPWSSHSPRSVTVTVMRRSVSDIAC